MNESVFHISFYSCHDVIWIEVINFQRNKRIFRYLYGRSSGPNQSERRGCLIILLPISIVGASKFNILINISKGWSASYLQWNSEIKLIWPSKFFSNVCLPSHREICDTTWSELVSEVGRRELFYNFSSCLVGVAESGGLKQRGGAGVGKTPIPEPVIQAFIRKKEREGGRERGRRASGRSLSSFKKYHKIDLLDRSLYVPHVDPQPFLMKWPITYSYFSEDNAWTMVYQHYNDIASLHPCWHNDKDWSQ